MSNIRVFVTFPTTSSGSAIFAGDTLQCKITFKNVPMAQPMAPPVPILIQNQLSSPQINGGAKKPTSITGVDKARGAAMSPRIPQSAQGHRPNLSLSVTANKSIQAKTSPTASPILENGTALGHKHKRSISIVSMNSELGEFSEMGRGHQKGASIGGLARQGPPLTRDNVRRGHGRSTSLQVSPRPRGVGSSPSIPPSVTSLNSPIINTPQIPPSATPRAVDSGDSMSKFSFLRRGSVTPGSTPVVMQGLWSPVSSISKGKCMHSDSLNMTFKFPTQIPQSPLVPPHLQPDSGDTAGEVAMKVTNIDLRSPLDGSSDNDSLPNGTPPRKAVVGLGINGGSVRTSGEFYSLANSTTETLVSEYDPRLPRNGLMLSQQGRAQSSTAGGSQPAEVLMMGYAQVIGTFILDGTLVQTSQFDDVKRRGVVGSQGGGGVVGVEQKTDGRFLGSFGWGSLGGAIGGLLGGNSMSSIADMKSQANQRSIPILSTPQSILFVNLKLAPGESRTYDFRFPLPKGLPPSHRGMAIKVNYTLKIGTQRAGKAVQQPKVIEIPFRVFPHVDMNGAFRSHDLLQPIILLRDEGKVVCVDENATQIQPLQQHPAEKLVPRQESSLRDFFLYVDSLMPQQPGMQLDSPSFIRNPLPTPVRAAEEPSSAENIEAAILRGGGVGGSKPPSARACVYEIARNGHKVASLTLPKPAYILGDTIAAVIDFSGAAIPCYHVGLLLSSLLT